MGDLNCTEDTVLDRKEKPYRSEGLKDLVPIFAIH